MSSKAEEILNKHKGSMDYIKGDVCDIYIPNLLEAMKEIASIAYDAGVQECVDFMDGAKINTSFVRGKSKEQFISKLFDNE